MALPNGTYVTEHGSVMKISGKHSGIYHIEWDRLEEGACFDCVLNPCEVDGDLTWCCETCGGGHASLTLDSTAE